MFVRLSRGKLMDLLNIAGSQKVALVMRELVDCRLIVDKKVGLSKCSEIYLYRLEDEVTGPSVSHDATIDEAPKMISQIKTDAPPQVTPYLKDHSANIKLIVATIAMTFLDNNFLFIIHSSHSFYLLDATYLKKFPIFIFSIYLSTFGSDSHFYLIECSSLSLHLSQSILA